MNTIGEQLLDSWNRQSRIMNSLAGLVNEGNRKNKPSEDGWPLDVQLGHVLNTRKEWLSTFAPSYSDRIDRVIRWTGTELVANEDLDKIKSALATGSELVAEAMRELLEKSGEVGPYAHPVQYLEHMIWHEGWHAGLIMLALRLGGDEPSEEWEELNIWGQWRAPEI